MLKRKVYEDLLKWKKKANGKALCIIGARQIGKTTLIREFGKNEYEHFADHRPKKVLRRKAEHHPRP